MIVLTVWPIGQWRAAVEQIRAIRPDAVMLHSDPDSIERNAASIIADMRKALGDAAPREFWIGIAGDVGHTAAEQGKTTPAALLELRMRAIRAAKKLGAARVMFDPESAWKHHTPGFDADAAKLFIATAKQELGDTPLLVTSFDCPGYHSSFPYSAFDGADDWAPQIYAAPEKGDPDPAAPMGRDRLKLHQAQWAQAQRAGKLKVRPVIAYVQGHHVVARETCAIANAHDVVCVWAAPGLLDAQGQLACRALTAIEKQGFRGPGRVERFQSSAGLAPDGLVGPATLAALGLSS